jgi:hypothetical protein
MKAKPIVIPITAAFVTVCALALADWATTGKRDRIHFSRTKSFERVTTDLPVAVEGAWKILLGHKGANDRAMKEEDHSALFFVNGEYCFSDPHKFCLSLSGYYINGVTGAITRRESTRSICRGILSATWDKIPSFISGIWFLPTDAYMVEGGAEKGATRQ